MRVRPSEASWPTRWVAVAAPAGFQAAFARTRRPPCSSVGRDPVSQPLKRRKRLLKAPPAGVGASTRRGTSFSVSGTCFRPGPARDRTGISRSRCVSTCKLVNTARVGCQWRGPLWMMRRWNAGVEPVDYAMLAALDTVARKSAAAPVIRTGRQRADGENAPA